MKYTFESKTCTHMTITAQKTKDAYGAVRLIHDDRILDDCYFKYCGFETYTLRLIPDTSYIIECIRIHISFAYAYGTEHLLEDGITCLVFKEDALYEYNKHHLHMAYAQPFRNQFHFSPFTGWMNDPNGLCWFQGYYHLFYQFNPNSDHWGNMHWGHAVSKDLLHFTHLPVVCYPQIELLDNPGFRGGAFSGSAVIAEDQMHLFFTRHFGKDDRSWQRQWQVTCQSNDGITFSPERSCIWGTPRGVFYDFRDPKVMPYKDKWIMVLGGTHQHRPAVLWYCSEDLEHWTYQGVLLEETDPAYGVSECPDLFPLAGQYVLLVGYICSERLSTARRDTKYYVGSFDGAVFSPVCQGLMDYGKDFYAVQTMAHGGRRIAIGWNTTADDVYISVPGCANGTASLPRELQLRDGHICSFPVSEVKALQDNIIFEGNAPAPAILPVGSPYCLELTVDEECSELSGILVENESESVEFHLRGQEFSLVTGRKSICCFPVMESVEELTIYVDYSLVELFINQGAYTCTRRFYLKDAEYLVKNLTLKDGSGRLKLTPMKSIW